MLCVNMVGSIVMRLCLSRQSWCDLALVCCTTGVRLEVCRKNVGKPRYAFNSFQVKMLPTIYRPPPITTGAVQS